MQNTSISNVVADNIRRGRHGKSWSRRQLAAQAGVSERYLTSLEGGAANASIGVLERIAEALGVEFGSLVSGSATTAGGDGDGEGASATRLRGLFATMTGAELEAAVAQLGGWLTMRRKTMRGLALFGLRGAGKTTIGRAFAERHAMAFVSITREVEARAGMRIGDLFSLGGADAYRALENDVIAELVNRRERLVVEAAGGIVANGEALERLLGTYQTVWIRAAAEDHLSRVARQGDMRPMRDMPKALEHLRALLAAREPAYARAAFVLDTSGLSVEDCVGKLESIADGKAG